MSLVAKVMSFFLLIVRVLNPLTWLGWILNNYKLALALSVLMNLTLIPLLSVLLLVDTSEKVIQAVGWLVGLAMDTCPDVKTAEDLRVLFGEFSLWIITRVQEVSFLEVMNTVCVCYLMKRGGQTVRFLPEKAMPGSPFTRAQRLPPFQAAVMELFDGAWHELGQCFRVGQVVVTAKHVIRGDAGRLRLQSARGTLEVEPARFHFCEGGADIAYAILDDREFTMLGLAKAKLVPATGDCGTAYATCQTTMEQTTGMVREAISGSEPLFGLVRYSGSTRPGFSGAPYYMTNKVYGMHTGAASENLGYDASYIQMKLRNLEESSEDYFAHVVAQHRRKGKKLYVHSTGDPDIVEVKINGQYFRLSRDAVDETAVRVPDVVHYDGESGNVSGPSHNASVLGLGLKILESSDVLKPNSQSSSPMQQSPKSAKEEKPTVPQGSTHVPRRSRSRSMSKSEEDKKDEDQRKLPSPDVLTIWKKLSESGASALSRQEKKSFFRYVHSISGPHQDTVSLPDSEARMEKS